MYMGPNKVARARRNYRTTVADPSLSGLWDKIQKVGYKLTKWIPRELSPTKMLKHSAKQKGKVTALQTALIQSEAGSADAVAQAQTDAQLKILQAAQPSTAAPGASFAVPTPTQSFPLYEQNPAQFAPVASVASNAAPVEEDNTVLYVGLGAAALLGVYLVTRGRK